MGVGHSLCSFSLTWRTSSTLLCAALRVAIPSRAGIPLHSELSQAKTQFSIGANEPLANSPVFPCPIREGAANLFSGGNPSCSSIAVPQRLGLYYQWDNHRKIVVNN